MNLSETYDSNTYDMHYDITYMKFFDEGEDYINNENENSYYESVCDIDYTDKINKPTYSRIYKIKRFFIIIFQFIFRN